MIVVYFLLAAIALAAISVVMGEYGKDRAEASLYALAMANIACAVLWVFVFACRWVANGVIDMEDKRQREVEQQYQYQRETKP